MPRFRKPFYRADRGLWYVQLRGKQINLGADKDAAFTEYHALMGARAVALAGQSATSAAASPALQRLLIVVVDEFLDWCEKHRAPDTYRWYKDRLNAFCQAIPAELMVHELRPYFVQKWVDAYEGISSGTKRNHCRAIMRAMTWAEEQGYVDRSPLAHFKKPRGGKREQVVTAEEYIKLLNAVKDQNFKDLLVVTWECGPRPQETLRVEARHVDLAHRRWVFPASEAKGGRLPRVVYLTDTALEVTRRLVAEYPQGPLFRNTDGLPWTADATNCRFHYLKRKLKVKYSLYALRHSFATRALQRGVDSLTVAHLLGHSDPSMLAKHYAHLSQAPEFLSGQLTRASA